MRINDLTVPAVIILVLVGISGAGAVYLLSSGEPEDGELPLELGPLTQSLSSLTSATVAEMGESSIEDISDTIERSMSTWIANSAQLVANNDIELDTVDVSITESNLAMDLPLPSSSVEVYDGTTAPDHRMFGSSGSSSMVPSLRTEVVLSISLQPDSGGEKETATISFHTDTVDPERALSTLLDMLVKDSSSWYSGFARDVEYILNALVRIRAANGIGTGFFDSYLNLLNGGDVELALNFALAVTMARWTGTVPSTLVNGIDAHFSDLEPENVMNPTGNRYWGTSEIDNFKRYDSRSGGDPEKRSADDLLSILTDFGHSDTADLFMRYLYLDRTGKTLGNTESLDLRSPLFENQLLDPRQPTTRIDSYSLERHPSSVTGSGIPVYDASSLLSGNETTGNFKPIFDTDFMILGKDVQVSGLHDYNAWFTNANLSLSDEDLIATGNGSQINNITRCGAIPPPPVPPNHDYRIQWDLGIMGSIYVTADSKGWSGNTYDPSGMVRKLNFSFPVRIYAGTGTLVAEGFEGRLRNINTGKQFYTPISTGWLITPIANATEYFESRVWPELMDAFSTLTSLSRSSGWADENLGQVPARQSIHSSTISAISSLQAWSVDTPGMEDLNVFYNNKVKVPGIDINDLGPLRIGGQNLRFSYSPARDLMEIRSELPQGYLSLTMGPISGGDPDIDARVVLWSGTRIEMDIDEGTFGLFGNFEGYDIAEGSSIPKKPSEVVTETITSDYFISPEMKISVLSRPNPYISRDSASSSQEISVHASLLLIGGDLEDPADQLSLLKTEDLKTEFFRLLSIARDSEASVGIRIRSEGGGMADLSRTFIITGPLQGRMDDLSSSGFMDQIILDMITSSRIDPVMIPGLEMIYIEQTPSWTLQVPANSGGHDVMSAVHITPLGQASISYYASNMHGEGSAVWTQVDVEGYLPLW